jgi:phage gpG-like protein
MISARFKSDEAKRDLKRIREAATPGSAQQQAIYRGWGMLALTKIKAWWDQNVKGGGAWKPLSPLTMLLRRQGGSRKMRDWNDAMAASQQAEILRDTRILETSITTGRGKGGVFELLRNGVAVGTNLNYARIHHEGGTSYFQFNDEAKARFQRNVLKVLPGRKPVRTPTGRKSRAHANWNPFYFILWNALQKRASDAMTIPRRPLLPELTESDTEDFARLTREMWDQIVSRSG